MKKIKNMKKKSYNKHLKELHGDLVEMQADTLDSAEYGVLRRSLLRSRGNVTAAARELSISLATMKRKIRQHGLDRQRDLVAEPAFPGRRAR